MNDNGTVLDTEEVEDEIKQLAAILIAAIGQEQATVFMLELTQEMHTMNMSARRSKLKLVSD